MRKIIYVLAVILAGMTSAGCQQGKGQQSVSGPCHIHGTISEQYNDKRVFLVPLSGTQTAEAIDSADIKNGKFELKADTAMVAQILMESLDQMGLQPLLVVTEPGDVKVVIDSISHTMGTPQNDSLEKWKNITDKFNHYADSLRSLNLNRQVDSLQVVYNILSTRMAKNLGEGPLFNFLDELFPSTYKKVMPDGSTVTIDINTHKPVSK